MKKILFAMLAAAMAFSGCRKQSINVGDGTGSAIFNISQETSGYVVKSGEMPEVDVTKFRIILSRKNGGYSQTWESFDQVPSVIELPSGEYTVTAQSPDGAAVAWDQPLYAGSKDFSVAVGAVSNVDLVCSLSNMKVTMNCSEDFMNELTSFEITVKSADGQLVWTRTEVEAGKAGYFNVAPLEIFVKGYRVIDQETAATQYLKISDVAAKDHHIINLDAKVTGAVNGNFGLTIDNTVNDRPVDIEVPGFEEIPVEGGDNGGDPEEPDPSTAPSLVWESNPDFGNTVISSSMDVNIKVLAPEAIKTFVVKVESPTDGFMRSVAAMVSPENVHYTEGEGGYVDLDLISDETAMSMLGELLPVGDALKGQTSVDFSLSALVPMILGFSPESGSQHSFTMNVSDNKGQTLVRKLTFVVE